MPKLYQQLQLAVGTRSGTRALLGWDLGSKLWCKCAGKGGKAAKRSLACDSCLDCKPCSASQTQMPTLRDKALHQEEASKVIA